MTARIVPQDWTHAMSTRDLERMYGGCVDTPTRQEILRELDRRDDADRQRAERIAAALAVNSAPSW